MVSVTKRISTIKQPIGGYLKSKDFFITDLSDNQMLNQNENIHPNLIGLAVDYLTRFLNATPIDKAFSISLKGAHILNKTKLATELLHDIKGTDDVSIDRACKMVGFDVAFRANPMGYRPVEDINPDKETIANIRIMVNRGLNFFKLYGPIVKDGFNFPGGYTSLVNSGDGDFLTEKTLWEFKVIKAAPKKEHSLQLLIYYLMGMRSIHPEFKQIENLGIFNPRLNKVYLLSIDTIPAEIINEVETAVIGY